MHQLLSEIKTLADIARVQGTFLYETAKAIHRYFPHYTWIGFYFLEEDKLYVGPYIGKPTPHTVIELDSGICGAAVSRQETIVVDDVSSDPRYLACSLETKSEIVIPIRLGGEIVGELDIDSDKPAAFSPKDKALLEDIASVVGQKLSEFTSQ